MCQKNKNLRNHGTSTETPIFPFRLVYLDDEFYSCKVTHFNKWERAFYKFMGTINSYLLVLNKLPKDVSQIILQEYDFKAKRYRMIAYYKFSTWNK